MSHLLSSASALAASYYVFKIGVSKLIAYSLQSDSTVSLSCTTSKYIVQVCTHERVTRPPSLCTCVYRLKYIDESIIVVNTIIVYIASLFSHLAEVE